MCPAVSLNICPKLPSGVHAATASFPPGSSTRASSLAAFAWSGANIEPKIETAASNDAVLERQVLGVALDELDLGSGLGGALARDVEQARRDIEPGHLRAGECRRDPSVARAARDVEERRPLTCA